MGMYSNDDWMARHNRNAAAYAEAMKNQEAAKERDRAAAERYLLAANNRPANHRSAEVLSAPLGGFKGSTKKDLDLGGLRMLKNAVTGQRSGDWEEQAKTDILAGITRPALVPATASVNAKEAVTWGILNAGLAKMQGKSWSEAMSEGIDGMVAGATVSIMPGSNLKGVTKVVADAGKFGALDTAGSLVKGESIGDALKDGAAGATAALAFGAVGEVYSKLPDPVKTFVRRVALGGAMGATMRGDESKKPMPTGSFEHLTEWRGANQGKGLDDYLGTISDQDAAAYSASFKDRKFELPEGVDFFSKEGVERYTLHNALMNRANVRQAAKAGAPKRKNISQMAKFLATDDVPETIFGIPVVTREDQYTDADLQFFKEHPEAGGYYDMGEGTPEDGTEEGAPVQDDLPEWDFIKGDGRDELLPAGKFNSFGGTLRHDGRAAMLNKDRDGKVVGYGTTESMVHYNPKDKRYYVIPTISQGARVDDPVAHFVKTGGFFASAKTKNEAINLSNAVHEHHQKRYGDLWNQYIQDNWDSMSDTIKSDPGVKDVHDARVYIEDLKVPTLSLGYNVIAKAEGFTPVAKPDVGGLSLGHGAHFYGAYKTDETKIKKGQKTTRLAAAQQFARDYYSREQDLAKEIPNFKLLSKESKVALVDIAFGKDGQLSKTNSPSLHRRLAAAKSTAEADRIVQDEYHTYGANEGEDVKGRRQLVAKALWGKTLEYKLNKTTGKYKGSYK